MPRPQPRILILRCGHTAPEVIRHHGDYDRWFTDPMEGLGCRFTIAHLPDGRALRTTGYDGILVTGSTSSVTEPEGWMGPLGDALARCVSHGPPALAVCFGAQMAATALGGQVERNPSGWEIGTIRADLNHEGRQDPLFAGLPTQIEVQATHEDNVRELPRESALLASNSKALIQAFAAGSRLRGVQFHPEASAPLIRLLVRLRRQRLEEDALAHGASDLETAQAMVSRIEAGIRDTPHGRRVLENWVRRFL